MERFDGFRVQIDMLQVNIYDKDIPIYSIIYIFLDYIDCAIKSRTYDVHLVFCDSKLYLAHNRTQIYSTLCLHSIL